MIKASTSYRPDQIKAFEVAIKKESNKTQYIRYRGFGTWRYDYGIKYIYRNRSAKGKRGVYRKPPPQRTFYAMALAKEAQVELVLAIGPRAKYDTSDSVNTPEGMRARLLSEKITKFVFKFTRKTSITFRKLIN